MVAGKVNTGAIWKLSSVIPGSSKYTIKLLGIKSLFNSYY
jgi:hypothetical protein